MFFKATVNLSGKNGQRVKNHSTTYRSYNSLKKFFFNVYLFLRKRQSASGGEAERGGDTQSETGSRLRTVSTEPDLGLELVNCEVMT